MVIVATKSINILPCLATMISLVQILLALKAIFATMVTILFRVIVSVILFAIISRNAMMVPIPATPMLLVPIILEVSVECATMVAMETVYNAKTIKNVLLASATSM